jgi:hypothetical protein
MKDKPTFIEQLRVAGQMDGRRRPATLFLDDQAPANGTVVLQESESVLVFVPDNGKTLDTPTHVIKLRLRDTGYEVGPVELQDCSNREHYHLVVPRNA